MLKQNKRPLFLNENIKIMTPSRGSLQEGTDFLGIGV